jgi:hypothetical protein
MAREMKTPRPGTEHSPAGGDAVPTVLLIFPEEWLPRRRDEWETLSRAASLAGFRAVVSHWNALSVADGAVCVREGMMCGPGGEELLVVNSVSVRPDVVLTTWGVGKMNRELFDAIVRTSKCCHSEVPLLARVTRKRALELCLRDYERRSGRTVSRPMTRLSDEIAADDLEPGDELVIVKPSRGGQCQGIEIVPRAELLSLAQEAASGVRAPFVVQQLVDNQFRYEGRRWDMRVHVLVTSLSPLRYRLYREGVAKTTAEVPTLGSARLEEWLNADSYMKDRGPAENLSISQMLDCVARRYTPLSDFWERVDDVVRDLCASIALWAEEKSVVLGRSFMFAGLDFIVEGGAEDYRIRLLELNSHPGLGWSPDISSQLLPSYREWFQDLKVFASEV